MYNLKELMREKINFINEALDELDVSKVHSILRIPVEYAISSGGKRLRPIICTLCAEVVGGDYRDTKDAFLALELIHNGTLVHDDIIDEDLFRRGTPSAPVKFGPKRAVLTGDALLSMGLKYAAKTGIPDVVTLLSETSLKMVQGVALQTFNRRKIVSEKEYLDINYLKSGSLFEAAAALGGLMGSGRAEDSERLAGFGRNFGNAYQIRDDICGVFEESENDNLSRNDLLNGEVTLPFIYALESDAIPEKDRRTITAVFMGEIEKVDPMDVQRIYEETMALERSIRKMKEFAELGRKYLDSFERSEAKEILNHMLDQYYKYFSPSTRLRVLV
ncbi:MAG: polyprenyl synthetase family protein [Candidatus Bathyarchaeia archaeon]